MAAEAPTDAAPHASLAWGERPTPGAECERAKGCKTFTKAATLQKQRHARVRLKLQGMAVGRNDCWKEEREVSAGWRTACRMQARGIMRAMYPMCHALPRFCRAMGQGNVLGSGV